MNWEHIKALLRVNTLYANPQLLAQVRAKQLNKPHKKISILKSIITQQVIISLIFIGIYGMMFIAIDYSKFPGLFSIQMAVFSLMSLATGFNSLFAVFYDSKDTKIYLALPVKAEEVYLSKLLAAQGSLAVYLLPLLPLMGIAYWQSGQPILALILAPINFFLLLLMLNAISLVLLNLIGEVLAKSTHKKLISTLLTGVSTLLTLVMIIGLNSLTPQLIDHSLTLPTIPYFRGFYDVVVNPFSTASLINFWLALLVLAGLVVYILKGILPSYFNQLVKIDGQNAKRKRQKRAYKERSYQATIIRHHLGTLKDGNLLVQAYIVPLIFCFYLVGPVIIGGERLSGITIGYYGIALLVGFFIGIMSTTTNSLPSVAISLERENFTFLKTLPISLKGFLRSKFHTLLVVQMLPVVAIHIILGLFFGLHPVLLLSYLLGALASSYLMGLLMFRRDYRLLTLNWLNISQLLQRGGNWRLGLIAFATMIGGMFLIGGAAALTVVIPPAIVSGAIAICSLALLGLGYWLIVRNFWSKFDQL